MLDYNRVTRLMFAASLESFSQLAPWADWMMSTATTLALALTTTHRVIDWVYCHTPDMRTPTQPTTSSRFAARNVHMFNVSDLADCRVRVFMNAPNLPGRHTHKRVTSFPVAQNCLLTCAPGYLAAPARNNLNVVNDRSQRNRFQSDLQGRSFRP